MVPTFILTRTFAISALIVGGMSHSQPMLHLGRPHAFLPAFPVTYGAPVPSSALVGRQCRKYGCLVAEVPDASEVRLLKPSSLSELHINLQCLSDDERCYSYKYSSSSISCHLDDTLLK